MKEILQELHRTLVRELGENPEPYSTVGTPTHQLKIALEGILEEIDQDQRYNPFELTNRVLSELDRHRRLKT